MLNLTRNVRTAVQLRRIYLDPRTKSRSLVEENLHTDADVVP